MKQLINEHGTFRVGQQYKTVYKGSELVKMITQITPKYIYHVTTVDGLLLDVVDRSSHYIFHVLVKGDETNA